MKRWIKLLLLIAAIPLVLGGGLYYILTNRLKNVLQYAIEKETNGGYAFRSKDINLSVWDKRITIDSLILIRKDTSTTPVYYNINIPRAYLSIVSWQELLANKRLAVDSFSVIKPDIVIHDYRIQPQTASQTSFHTSNILENLRTTLEHLHAKSFNVAGASFTLYKRKAAAPFVVRDVSIRVRNFSRIDNDDRRVFGSDQIELGLGRQQWILSDGKNTLSFQGMRFSSATQLVEIDSIHFHRPATAETGETSLRADKFFVNSRRLPAIYQRGELWLDTLICVRPVLTLPSQAKNPIDTTNAIQANIKSLFRTVNIRYTAIKDGEIILAHPTIRTASAHTKKANLTIYNLTITPQKVHPLSTDSIKLDLNNIVFYSKDSLSKIAVESFTLRNRDVIFNHVLYGPTSRNASGKALTFTAPVLRLKNISLEDLIQKRLIASDADLVQPTIRLQETRKGIAAAKLQSLSDSAAPKKVDVYKTLHGLGELIQVANFHLIDGRIHYSLSGDKPVEVSLKNMNMTILLKNFLKGDSLVDLKHAIPSLLIGQANVVTNALKLGLTNYRIDGKKRHNWVDNLTITLANGTTLRGKQLYWEAFDWDVIQQTRDIQIDSLRIHELSIEKTASATPPSARPAGAATPPKPLPVIRIGHLMTSKVVVKATLGNQTAARFQGETIKLDNLSTEKNHVQWEQFSGKLRDITISQPGGMQLSIAAVSVSSHQTSTLTNLHYADTRPGQSLHISLPQLRIKGPFPSTNMSDIKVNLLEIDRPELTIVTEANAKPTDPTKAFTVPLSFAIAQLKVDQARLNYVTRKAQDSVTVRSIVDVEAKALYGAKEKSVTFASLRVSPSDINLKIPRLSVTVPAANVQLTDGTLSPTKAGKPSLQAHLKANMTIDDLHPVLASKKSKTPLNLSMQRMDADIDLPNFRWTAGQKLAWAPWVDRTNLSITKVFFQNATTSIKAEKMSWEAKSERVGLDNFQISPTMSKEEFMTPPHLQADYITIEGDRLEFNGLKTARWRTDSTIAVNHIVVKNVTTNVSRDKRLPDPAILPTKLMPTRLIGQLKIPFRIDSISVVNSNVIYHETSKVTNRVGSIPLKEINGILRNVTNRPTKLTDSLVLKASTKLLGLNIQRLHYRESYGDSLAGFHMLLKTSDLNLPEFTQITNPMAAADLDGGYVKPIVVRVAGNKYASVGDMHFHYKDLKIRLLSHADTTRKSLLLKFENFIVGKVLRKKNETDTRIFYDRDQRTFIFGYWIKTIMSGVLTSVGVKGNKKYHANYVKLRQLHTLPAEDE